MEPNLRKPLIVGNWKLHGTVGETIKWITGLKNLLTEAQHIETVVAPPFTALYSASIALTETHIQLAAQDLYWEDEGAFTGAVSGPLLKEVGCSFVLVGHSERRQYFGDTDWSVNLKVHAALKSELVPILCVGETLEQREKSQTLEVIESQMKKGLDSVAIHDFERLVLAYEPVWAIGTGRNATPAQAGEVHQFMRSWLRKFFDAPTANRIHLLYGGSVKPDNAAALMAQTHVDGLLVGGASLDPESFAEIITFEERSA